MTKLTLVVPTTGEFNTVAEPKVDTAFTEIQSFINGKNLDGTFNIAEEGVAEGNLTSAVQTKLNQKSSGLELVKQNGSTTGESGKLYYMEKAASTLTLPAATINRQVAIFAAAEGVKVKTAAGAIFGDFLAEAGVAEITLTLNQHVTLEATGANWLIVAGEPKRAQPYVAHAGLEFAKLQEPSAVRPTFVTAIVGYTALANAYIQFRLVVGGQQVGEWFGAQPTTEEVVNTFSFFCPPAVKWEVKVAGMTVMTGLTAFYLTL